MGTALDAPQLPLSARGSPLRMTACTSFVASLAEPTRPVGAPMHDLPRPQARRIAVQAQLLDAHRPAELHAVVRQLTLLQIDPIAAIAPNADLVAWSRLGSSYSPD